MKKVRKIGLRILAGMFGALLTYFLFAVILGLIPSIPEKSDCKADERFYLYSNGVHVFIILPANSFTDDFKEKAHIPADINWVSTGWGEKDFYLNTPTWDDLTFSTAVGALFWPSTSALNLSYYRRPLDSWVPLEVCRVQIKKMAAYTESEFAEKNGEFIELKANGYGSNDYFFLAKGRYHCFKTCNVWIGSALKAGSIRTAVWSPFEFGIMRFAVDD